MLLLYCCIITLPHLRNIIDRKVLKIFFTATDPKIVNILLIHPNETSSMEYTTITTICTVLLFI